MITLSYKELKAVAKIRKIKGYKRISEDEFLKALEESEKPKPPKTIKEIRKENYDSNEIIRDLRAFYESEEDYYEPQKTKGAFNDNYIEYESNGNKDKRLSIEEYLNMIRAYLSNIIDDHKDEWKIQLTMEISLISTIEFGETSTMHIKSKNVVILTSYETDEIVEELFDSLLKKYKEGLEEKIKRSNHAFDSVDVLYYKLHKTSLNRARIINRFSRMAKKQTSNNQSNQ